MFFNIAVFIYLESIRRVKHKTIQKNLLAEQIARAKNEYQDDDLVRGLFKNLQ